MRRYWFNSQCRLNENKICFQGELFHHIVEVCRQSIGSKFEFIMSDDKVYLVQITKLEKKIAHAQILEERLIQPLSRPHIHLALSLSRFPTMDSVIEKMVELGVYQFHPFVSDYSFIRKADDRLIGRFKRWEKIVIAATQQSGRGELMRLAPPSSLTDLLKDFSQRQPKAMGLFSYEGIGVQHVRQALKQMHLQDENREELWLFVGSEGGYSETEVKLFADYQLQSTTLGSQVLRVETACVALVSILKYEWDLLK